MEKIYNNYFSGSVSQISDCLEIILFNKSSIVERISLYNIESFYLKYLTGTSEIYSRLTRNNTEEGFEYKKSLPGGFNVVVYISPVSNSPIGFTEFLNTQGIGISLGIQIDVSRTLKEELDLVIKNQLSGKDLSKDFGGTELTDYTYRGELVKRKYKNLHTSDIERLKSDYSSFIISSSGVITKDATWKLEVKKNVTVEYENAGICFYSGSLVLSSWSGKNYLLTSLTGDEVWSGETNTPIKKIVGRYYIGDDNILRCLETGKIIEKTKKTQFPDYLNPHCTLYNLPVFYSKAEIFKYIPEINNIYLDLDTYLRSNQLIVHSKIGSWFVLSRNYGGTTIYLAVSPTSVVTMTMDDLENAIFVGDQTVILKESGYYMVYNTEGTELTTERARAILLGGRLDKYEISETSKILYCFLDTDEDQTHFEEYYGEEGLVKIVFDYEDLSETVLNKYRRSVYPECSGIPDLIGSFGGLIFYKVGGKLNLL